MSTILEAFENLPFGKEEVGAFSAQLNEAIENGEIDPLRFKIFVKGMETVFANIKETLDREARNAAEQHGGKEVKVHGATVLLVEAGTKYDYSNCNHPMYSAYQTEEKKYGEMRKALEKTLQSLKGKTIMGDPETGESFEVFPPVKQSTSTLQIRL
jgi:hypothetical protein